MDVDSYMSTHVQNDRQSPQYGWSPQPTEHYFSADMSVVKVKILRGTLVKLTCMSLSIISEIRCMDHFTSDAQ